MRRRLDARADGLNPARAVIGALVGKDRKLWVSFTKGRMASKTRTARLLGLDGKYLGARSPRHSCQTRVAVLRAADRYMRRRSCYSPHGYVSLRRRDGWHTR